MKTLTFKTFAVLLIAFSVITMLGSCKKESSNPLTSTNAPATSVNNFVLINQGLIDGMTSFISSNKNSFKYESSEDAFGSCGSLSIDTLKQPYTKIWNFGAGCTGHDGHYRAGQIVITYNSSNYRQAGDTASVTFNSFVLDSVTYTGGMTITSYTDGSGYINFSQAINATMTVSGTGYPVTGTLNWQWIKGINNQPAQNIQFSVTGSVNGFDKNKNAQTVTITSALLRNFATTGCNYFVEGDVTVATAGSATEYVDYGNGTSCSGTYTVTVNGTPTTYQQ
jgi:hypothetical protein